MATAQLWIEAVVLGLIGRYEESYRAGSAAMANSYSANAVYAVDVSARTALWMNDPMRARDAAIAADQLKFPGRVFKAMLTHARATADAMDGKTDEALAGYREVLASYRDLQFPLLTAWAKTDMAIALGPSVAGSGCGGRRSARNVDRVRSTGRARPNGRGHAAMARNVASTLRTSPVSEPVESSSLRLISRRICAL